MQLDKLLAQANQYYNNNNYDKALKLYHECLVYSIEYFGECSEVANLHSSIAITYKKLGEYPNALQYANQSLEIRQKLLEKDKIAFSINFIGSIYEQLGNYIKALEHFQKALSLHKELHPYPYKHIATSYMNIASIYNVLGNYNQSITYYNEALQIYKDKSIVDNRNILFSNLGLVYLAIKEYKKALECFEEALSLDNSYVNASKATTANLYNNIANVYSNLNNFDKALEYFTKSLTLTKSIYGLQHPQTAAVFNNLGVFSNKQNFYDEALVSHLQALNISKNTLGKDHPNNRIYFANLAGVYENLNDYNNAYFNLLKYMKLNQKYKSEIYVALDNKEKISYLNAKVMNIYDFLRVAYEKNKHSNSLDIQKTRAEIYEVFLHHKGSYQDEFTFLSILKNSIDDTDLISKIDSLQNSKYKLAKILQSDHANNAQTEIDAIEDAISKDEVYLSSKMNKFKIENNFHKISHIDIAKNLKENEIFIDFSSSEEHYYIFIINHQQEIDFIKISIKDTQIIKKNIHLFQQNIEALTDNFKPATQYFENSKKEINSILQTLYEKLITNYLTTYIDRYKKWIIAPDGILHFLAFDALYDGKEYLLSKLDISYIPSGRELIRLKQYKSQSIDNKKKITIFANPNFEYTQNLENTHFRSSAVSSSFQECSQLSHAKEEATSIQNIYKEEATLYIDDDANESKLKELQHSNILHFATHGFIINDSKQKEPLLRTAIALAGYNHSIKNKLDYGIVNGLKIASLDFSNLSLIVLSACDTANGDNNDILGVSSLSNAFFMAGAKSTIANLWKVNDSISKKFFTDFYTNTNSTNTHFSTFKETQRNIYNMCKENNVEHPLLWACFGFYGVEL
jgi:CHAT domain-containing protein/Tfp pilus assembly protein PilF